MILPVHSPGIVGKDVRGDGRGFLVLVIQTADPDVLTAAQRGPELLALASGVVPDDLVGRVQDLFRTAVVLLEPDAAAAGKLLLEGQDVFDRCPAETVDALVVVPDHAEVSVPSGQQRDQQILQMVGVLILVHHDVREALLPVKAAVLVTLQQQDGVQNQIVKVHRVCRKQAAGVFTVELRYAHAAQVAAGPGVLLVLLRQHPGVLGPADLAEDRARLIDLFIQIPVLQDLLHQRLAVCRVVNAEAALIAQQLGLLPQDAQAGGVEGTCPDVVRTLVQQLLETQLQLLRRLVRKGDGENAPGPDRVQNGIRLRLRAQTAQRLQALFIRVGRQLLRIRGRSEAQQVRDALDQHRRFAAAGTRQDQHRPLRRQHGLPLHGVQSGKPVLQPGPPRGDIFSFELFVIHGGIITCLRFFFKILRLLFAFLLRLW